MGYVAGVDLGTTYSAAAVFGPEGLAAVDLGPNSTVMPSVVAIRPGGEVLTGTNAERRLVSDPSTVAREFKRRLGDSTPILLGGTPYATADLTGYLLAAIVELVGERQGAAPDLVGLSHPANYGDFKLDLLESAARTAGISATTFVAEPVAAAVHYSQTERVATDDVIAVYDLGGGTFDASLVRRTSDGFEVIGTPDGMDRFGGIDLDEAVLGHVRRSVDGELDGLDPSDPAVMAALNRLRDDCRAAKEALSGDAEVEIPVMLPGLHTEVRLTRLEFEDMIRPRVQETIDVLQRSIRSAGIEVDDVSRVLLVGGSSRIPLIGEMVTQELGKPLGLDAHPKLTVALGTARVASDEVREIESPPVPPIIAGPETAELAGIARLAAAPDAPVPPAGPETGSSAEAQPVPPEPTRPIGPFASVPELEPPPRRRWPLIVGAVAALALLAAGAVFALSGGGGDGDQGAVGTAATTSEQPMVDVPSVVGREAVAARDALVAAGLDVVVDDIEVAVGSVDDGFVVAQSIPAGTAVERGTTITITVGRAVADSTAPATTAATSTTSSTTSTTSTTTSTTSTTTTSTTAPPTPEEQLAMFIAEDAATVAAVAESWLPQLSAKRFGLEVAGILYGYDEILDDHQARRDQYGAVLVDGGTYNFSLDGEPMEGWYMTIVPQSFETAEGALNWCRLRAIGRDDCFARFLSADPENTEGTVRLQ